MQLLPRSILRTPVTRAARSDDHLGRGMDIALVTLLFLGIGWAVDGWLDTRPIFTIALVVLCLVGQFVRMWYAYDETMRRLEAERRERAAARTTEP